MRLAIPAENCYDASRMGHGVRRRDVLLAWGWLASRSDDERRLAMRPTSKIT
jgi:hypothetical protein